MCAAAANLKINYSALELGSLRYEMTHALQRSRTGAFMAPLPVYSAKLSINASVPGRNHVRIDTRSVRVHDSPLDNRCSRTLNKRRTQGNASKGTYRNERRAVLKNHGYSARHIPQPPSRFVQGTMAAEILAMAT